MKVLALDRIVEGVEPERAGAVLILECEDLEEARVVDALPLTRRGLVGWGLIPLGASFLWRAFPRQRRWPKVGVESCG